MNLGNDYTNIQEQWAYMLPIQTQWAKSLYKRWLGWQEPWEPQAKAVLCRVMSGSGLAALNCRRTKDYGQSHERATVVPGGSSRIYQVVTTIQTQSFCVWEDFFTQFLERGQSYWATWVIVACQLLHCHFMETVLGELVKMVMLEVFWTSLFKKWN